MRLYSSALALSSFLLLAATASAATLPLARVRLYETGVGYFERTGVLDQKGAAVSLPVPAGHLDDALKTLVVLSKDGKATVSGIEFGSSVSRDMARALAGLPADSGEAVRFTDVVESLKGAGVELRAGGAVFQGRIVDVVAADAQQPEEEVCTASKQEPGKTECVKRRVGRVLLLTHTGEIRHFRDDEVESVRPTDPAFKARLSSALDALGERGSQTRRDLRVLGTAGQAVTLGYVAESPVWRSTYRLVLDDKPDASRLQGWALLHNDTDEDWKGVKVELVNGQPDSFLFPIAAPRYAYRELVTPERELSTVPQLLDRTVDNMWSSGGLGLSGVGEGGGGYGYGVGLGSIGTIGHGAGVGNIGPAQSSLLAVGNLANVAQADAVEAGALFRYALPEPIDLRAHGSALMPFVDQALGVERIAYFDHAGDAARSAVYLEHNGTQTCPAGTIAVFEGGGFAGESSLSRTKPGESRVIRYGYDLDVDLDLHTSESQDTPKVFLYRGGRLEEHFLRKSVVTYALVNRSGAARKVYLALGFVNNADVKGADALEFDDESSRALAVFSLAARAEQPRTIEVVEGLSRTFEVDALSSKNLAGWAARDTLSTEQRGILAKAAEAMGRSEASFQAATRARRELDDVQGDIERLRDDVRALGGRRNGASDTLVKRLLAAEDQARALRDKAKELDARGDKERKRARRLLAGLKAS